MEGILTLKGGIKSALLLLPLLGATILWAWHMHKNFEPLSRFVSLSSVFEVQRGEETADVTRLRAGHPVTWSQRSETGFLVSDCECILISKHSNLNRRRYAQNDETLYVAPEDERTDYVRLFIHCQGFQAHSLISLNHQWRIGTAVYSSRCLLYLVMSR